MRLADANGDFWYDFGDEPNEKARQFMKEHFGFETIDHLSDDECEEIQYEIAEIQAYLES